VKEFTSSVASHAADGTPKLPELPFLLDGEDYVMRPPKNSQMAYIMAAQASGRTDADRVAAMLDFLEATLVEPGRERLRTRMLDSDDPLDLDVVEQIIEWAMQEWSGRPPTSPSVSSSPSPNAGRPLTAIASGGALTP